MESDDGEEMKLFSPDAPSKSIVARMGLPDSDVSEDDAQHVGLTLAGVTAENQKYRRLKTSFVSVIVVTVVIIVSILAVTYSSSVSLYKASFNFTADASIRKAWINNSFDRCDDFYNYACRNLIDQIQTGPNVVYYTQGFSGLALKISSELDGIINAGWPFLESYQRSCMNETAINRRGTSPISLALLRLGSSSNLKNLMNLAAQLRVENGIDLALFFSVFVSPDDLNPDQNVVKIVQSGFNLPTKQAYSNVTLLQSYASWIAQAFSNANIRLTETQIQDIIALEASLANITTDSWQDVRLSYNTFSRTQLNSLLGAELFGYVEGIGFNRSDILFIVDSPSYLASLRSVLSSYSLITIRYHAYLRLFMDAFPLLGSDQTSTIQQFRAIVYGSSPQPVERYSTCKAHLKLNLGMLLSHYWVTEYYSDTTQEEFSSFMESLKQTYIDMMNTSKNENTNWLDETTRNNIIEKFQKMDIEVGYPPEWENPEDLLRSMIGVNGLSLDFYENTLNLKRAYDLQNLRSLSPNSFSQKNTAKRTRFSTRRRSYIPPLSVDPLALKWDMLPIDVNAYWDWYNQIVIPAAIQQAPFYDPNQPDVLNYACMGAVNCHELTHSWDPYGSQYDALGRLDTIITPESMSMYRDHQMCLQDQFSAYTEDSEHLNGALEIGEIVADLMGQTVAYTSFLEQRQKDLSRTAEQDKAVKDAYGMTWDELWFVGHAQLFCAKIATEYMHNGVLADSHPPPDLRIRGTFSNMPQFSSAMDCPEGSTYNPIIKCNF